MWLHRSHSKNSLFYVFACCSVCSRVDNDLELTALGSSPSLSAGFLSSRLVLFTLRCYCPNRRSATRCANNLECVARMCVSFGLQQQHRFFCSPFPLSWRQIFYCCLLVFIYIFFILLVLQKTKERKIKVFIKTCFLDLLLLLFILKMFYISKHRFYE